MERKPIWPWDLVIKGKGTQEPGPNFRQGPIGKPRFHSPPPIARELRARGYKHIRALVVVSDGKKVWVRQVKGKDERPAKRRG